MYEVVIRSGSENIGGYTVSDDGELTYLYVNILIRSVPNLTNESIYLRATRSSFPAIPVDSQKLEVSSFATGLESWIGYVRFDFDSESLRKDDTLAIDLVTENYTQYQSGVEISAVLNFIDSSNGAFDVKSDKGAYLTLFNNR